MSKADYKILPVWAGGVAYIIGGGPSVNNINFDLLKDKKIIGCNNAFELDVAVDVCWSGDMRWLLRNKEKLRHFGGLKLTCVQAQQIPPGIHQLQRGKLNGIEKDPRKISWNHNTGASAINVAYHFGAKKIVLLGFDMQHIEGKNNWHDSHAPTWSPAPDVYEKRFLPKFNQIKIDADALGLDIVNATPGSALTLFPIVELKDVI